MFVSGVILLATCTVMYTEQIATLAQMLPLAFAGAMLSDHCGFYIGRLGQNSITLNLELNTKRGLKRQKNLLNGLVGQQ